MRILHTADLHLRQVGDERWEALLHLLDRARELRVDALVVSGDLFDRTLDAEALRPEIRRVLSGLPFPVVVIPGNHDQDAFAKGYFFGDSVRVIHAPEEPLELEAGVRIWGLPYEDRREGEMRDLLLSLRHVMPEEGVNLLLYHGDLLDAFYGEEDTGEEKGRYMPVRLDWFAELPVHYVLAGHFHTRYDVRAFAPDRFFVYPGSPVSITRREVGQRRACLVEVGHPPSEIPLDTLHHVEVDLVLDPLDTRSPLGQVQEILDRLHPRARVLLRVAGYLDSETFGLTEEKLLQEIRWRLGDRLGAPIVFEVRDVAHLLQDPLFRDFEEQLEQEELDPEEMRALRDLVLQALMEMRARGGRR